MRAEHHTHLFLTSKGKHKDKQRKISAPNGFYSVKDTHRALSISVTEDC